MFEVTIPIAPAPASRPKVGRYGTYYAKSHTAYSQECSRFLAGLHVPVGLYALKGVNHVSLEFIFYCKKAKNSTLLTPRYDIDNLVKLIMDEMTSCGKFFSDDVQVTSLIAIKLFANPGEERTEIKMELLPV